MFLFFFELTIALQSPEERNHVSLEQSIMADIYGVLSLSRFPPTNIKMLLLLFTEYPFSLLSHAGNTFVIGFMFYWCLLGVVTHKNCDETRLCLSFLFLAQPSQGLASKITFCNQCSRNLARWHVLVKFSALK